MAFADPSLPFVVDIGCAKGAWAIEYAKAHQGVFNVLGLEIRDAAAEIALARKQQEELDNVHFLNSNANVDLDRILSDIVSHPSRVNMVTIQFPDPYFKKKQQKRRVLNGDLLDTL